MQKYDLTSSYITLAPESSRILKSSLSDCLEDSSKYNSPQGYIPLIEHIKSFEQVPDSHDVLVTASSTEALYIVLQLLPDNRIFVETPCYFGLLRQIKHLNMSITSINSTQSFYFHHEHNVLPFYINPFNLSFSNEFVIDDSPYGLINFETRNPLPYTCSSNYFRVGSFSKLLGPDFRVGYLIFPKAFLHKLKGLKITINLSTSSILQKIISTSLTNGIYSHQLHHYLNKWNLWKESGLPIKIIKGGILTSMNCIDHIKLKASNIITDNLSFSYLSNTPKNIIRINFTKHTSQHLFDLLHKCIQN